MDFDREEASDRIAEITVDLKLSHTEIGWEIGKATGVTVDLEADDLLAILEDPDVLNALVHFERLDAVAQARAPRGW